MPTTTLARLGAEGIDEILCLQVPDGRSITYWLDHWFNHATGDWYNDYAVMDGKPDATVSESVKDETGTRKMSSSDSSILFVVRRMFKGGVMTNTIIAAFYRPGANLDELRHRIKNELS